MLGLGAHRVDEREGIGPRRRDLEDPTVGGMVPAVRGQDDVDVQEKHVSASCVELDALIQRLVQCSSQSPSTGDRAEASPA